MHAVPMLRSLAIHMTNLLHFPHTPAPTSSPLPRSVHALGYILIDFFHHLSCRHLSQFLLFFSSLLASLPCSQFSWEDPLMINFICFILVRIMHLSTFFPPSSLRPRAPVVTSLSVSLPPLPVTEDGHIFSWEEMSSSAHSCTRILFDRRNDQVHNTDLSNVA